MRKAARFSTTFTRLTCLLVMSGLAAAATDTARPSTTLSSGAYAVIERFLVEQTVGMPGKVAIRIDASATDALPPCAALEAFLPSGARPWGKLSVGLRCNSDHPWTRYVSTQIAVVGVYYVAVRPISAGQELSLADTQGREGDLTGLAGSLVTDPAQLTGVVAANRIAAGVPLRRELLRAVSTVQRGQTVKLVTAGLGFVISTEGKAMSDATTGALIQVKRLDGQRLSGIVRPDGVVQLSP